MSHFAQPGSPAWISRRGKQAWAACGRHCDGGFPAAAGRLTGLGLGLAIGRLVFGALNTAEIVLAAAVLTCLFTTAPYGAVNAAIAGTAILLVQVFAVRPHLTRRSNRILAGANAPRSNGHHVYIALEAGKVIALLTTGILLLSPT
jgi:hypothetical protein